MTNKIKFNLDNQLKKLEPGTHTATIDEVVENSAGDLEIDLSFTSSDFDFADDIIQPDNYTTAIPNKPAKETLIDFIKNSEYDVPYILNFNGTYESAEKFIQRMRVELSRFRAQIIKLNKPLNHFYVLTKSINVESETTCIITLIKSKERAKKKTVPVMDAGVLDFLTNEE